MTPRKSALQGPELLAELVKASSDLDLAQSAIKDDYIGNRLMDRITAIAALVERGAPCASCADKDDIIEGLKRVNGQLAQALHSERIYMRKLEDDNAAR